MDSTITSETPTATVTARLIDGETYSLAIINSDGIRLACHGKFSREGDCFWINGHAHSLPGCGNARYMRENSLSWSTDSVRFVGPVRC